MSRGIPISVCVGLSLAMHMVIIIPALSVVVHAHVEVRSDDSSSQIEPLLRVPDDAEELSLGLDAPSPARMTWVGFDEYQEHIAALAEIEQAAFVDEQLAGSPQITELKLPQNADPQPMLEVRQASQGAPLGFTTADLIPFRSVLDELVAAPRAPMDQETAEAPAPVESVQEVISAADAAASQTPPAAPLRASDGQEPGTPADKESQPASVIDVPPENWRLGKPLAAQGLELKTRKPDFTLLTLLTAAPANPICEIIFDRRGVPIRAALVRNTGDKRVDDAIVASLYRWRASGAPLTALSEQGTIEVQMRLLLNRRR